MALKAAINIEKVQLKRPADMTYVESFFNSLGSELDNSESPAVLRDETLFPYYSMALSKADAVEPLTRNQFSDALRGALARHRLATESDDLEKAKQFCLAFHEAIIRAIQQRPLGNARIDGRIR